jgi:CDGSH-type Zn-finger protein/truncated hemoglobin YjbI
MEVSSGGSSESLSDIVAEALRDAIDLANAWSDGAERLQASVIRPLGEVMETSFDGSNGSARSVGDINDRLWALTKILTALSARPHAPWQVVEAAAALQELARAQGQLDAPALAELVALQGEEGTRIMVAENGPYLVSGAKRLTNHLGVSIPTTPTMALCRCGASGSKPFCDGSERRVGFSGAKDPHRVPDRRETYVGTSVTVHDNRGLCAHSGFCTDRLRSVFHADRPEFVTPSGGRMDEIVNAVRACPSGALSFAVDGREAREQVDQSERREAIEVSKDGPYRVTGGIELVDEHGAPVPRPEGASLEHYSLCRCGHSQNKPFCSGMHWYVGFSDPPRSEDVTLFEWAGGFPALLRVTKIFYAKYVPQDPLLSPLFSNMSPDHPELVASWLSEVFGGPAFYSGTYGGYKRMISQHLDKHLTEEQRARWATLMGQAANDAMLPNDAEFRAAFVAYIEWGTRIALENSQPGAKPPPDMPMPRWWWVCNATPDARQSALAEPVEEGSAPMPAEDEDIGFESHVKTFFRRQDRASMKFVFDLWSYEDVSRHADAILHRVTAGTMPCDGAWPQDKVDAFRRWVERGKRP